MLTVITRACALALVATGLWGVPASAASYPGERDWTEPLADATFAAADAYWTRLGVSGSRPRMLVAGSLLDTDGVAADGRGSAEQQALWVTSESISPYQPLYTRRLCALVTHELGHVRGMSHTADPTSVMHAHAWIVTAECDAQFPLPVAVTEPVSTCQPAWAMRSTLRVRRLWAAERFSRAYREFRRWAKCHPRHARRVRAGQVC